MQVIIIFSLTSLFNTKRFTGGVPGSPPPTPLVPAVTFDRLPGSDAGLGE